MSSQSTPVLTVGTVTSSEINVSWTGAEDATSFSYTLNGISKINEERRVSIFNDSRCNALASNGTMWVGGGSGLHKLVYSYDRITWTVISSNIPIFEGGGCYTVLWNGSMWVAGGSGSIVLAHSSDGINWIAINSPFLYCLSLAWNGSLWVAGGSGTNTLAYSSDGINWTGIASAVFSNFCSTVIWDGSKWLACGQGINSLAYYIPNAYSMYPNSWTPSDSGNVLFPIYCETVAYNGSIWVASSGDGRMGYSSDGVTWISGFSFAAKSVVWNGSIWVAGGQGTNQLAYSSDGINWTLSTSSIFTGGCFIVTWNGTIWLAGGGGDLNTGVVAYSSDGINWTASYLPFISAKFTGLEPFTAYDLIVRAIYTDGSETPSASTTITTLMPDPPTLPLLEATVISTTQINISWTGGDGATSYIYLLNNVAVTPSVNNGIIDKTAVFNVSSNITSFTIAVTAVNIAASTTSEPVTILTLAPTKPVLSNLNSANGKFVTIFWSGGDGASSYTYTISGSSHDESGFVDGGLSEKFISIKPNPIDVISEFSIVITATNAIGSINSDPIDIGNAVSGFLQNINGLTAYDVISSGFTLSWYGGTTLSPTQQIYEYFIETDSSNNTIIPSSVGFDNQPFSATFTGLTLTSQNYNITVKITALFSFGGEIANTSETTTLSVITLNPPTQPIVTVGTITGTTVSLSWTGGEGATSYTYTLESVTPSNDLQLITPVALNPTNDNGVNGKSATYTGLTPSTVYNISVNAVNSDGNAANVVQATTLAPPPAPTEQAVTTLTNSFSTAITSEGSTEQKIQAASSAITTALAASAPETVVAAVLTLAIDSPAIFTALVSNPVFVGASISIPSSVAQTLYTNFAIQSNLDKTLPLKVNFPAADGTVTPPTSGTNSKLAIDLNGVDKFVPFRGCTGYGIRLTNGVQRYVTPTDISGTVVSVGDIIRFTIDGGGTIVSQVADLDIALIPYTTPRVICFLGSAPVLTPSGYTRMDSLSVGDVVSTREGDTTAVIERVEKQVYMPGRDTNPYLIPAGRFGSNSRLLISPRHKVAVNGQMIEARFLGLEQEEQYEKITYYNIQVTNSENIIVAGLEVESLQALVRINIPIETFNYIINNKYGGKISDEMKERCHLMPDGTISVPMLA